MTICVCVLHGNIILVSDEPHSNGWALGIVTFLFSYSTDIILTSDGSCVHSDSWLMLWAAVMADDILWSIRLFRDEM